MDMVLHSAYPNKIENPLGIILAVKIVPNNLPKEGPKPIREANYPAILFACNTWTCKGGPDLSHWEWYYFPDSDLAAMVENFVRQQTMNFHQWYYLDVFNFGEQNGA